MKTGLKSILFGVHQFIYHPITVLLAWIELYNLPNYKELVCIFIHDLGYYNCEKMDNEKGQNHPEFSGKIAFLLFKDEYYKNLCLGHSRHYAKNHNINVSKLFYADKLSMKYDHPILYLIRSTLSEELKEYMGHIDNPYGYSKNKLEWCKSARQNGINLSKNKNAIPYLKIE
jgi:hypothetical protein